MEMLPPNHQQTGRIKKVGKDILPQKHHHEVYTYYIPMLWAMLVVRVETQGMIYNLADLKDLG